jgi:hypothetical protein
MVYYIKLAGECLNEEGEFEVITLTVGFKDQDAFDEMESDGFDSIYHKFDEALDKDGSGYSLDGCLEVAEILGDDDDDNGSYDSDYDDSKEDKYVADFMA